MAESIHAFQVELQKILKSLKELPAEQLKAGSQAEELSVDRLRELLAELEPNLKKRQPKHCAPVLEKMMSYSRLSE